MTADNPNEFKDEELWLNIFPTNAFKWLLGTIIVWVVLVKFFDFFGLGIIGGIIGAIQCIVLTATHIFHYPQGDAFYMKGGGVLLFTRLLRLHYRKKNRYITVKHLEPEVLCEEEKA